MSILGRLQPTASLPADGTREHLPEASAGECQSTAQAFHPEKAAGVLPDFARLTAEPQRTLSEQPSPWRGTLVGDLRRLSGEPTIAEAVNLYLDSGIGHLSPRGAELYRATLEMLRKDMGGRTLGTCKPIDLVRWIQGHPQWRSAWTLRCSCS